MTIVDLRKLGDAELREKMADLQEQYFRRRFTSDPKRIQNPGKYRAMRKEVARIQTLLNERKRQRAAQREAVAAENAAAKAE